MSRMQQRGFSLLVVMVFLLVLGLLGFAVTKSAIVQEKIAGNLREKNVAFFAAEAALREGEIYLGTADDLSNITASVPLPSRATVSPLGGASSSYTISCVNNCTASGGKVYYRIQASATGLRNDPNSVTALESVVSVEE
ncbi:pilus assembly PilX family protein [Vogesella urethralis]|uniref:pilus assembly PilX family protein n=1 Tax=Vogesella urethralis TaxID=2592656 RepID=UPI001184BD45|nr:PilX N-terminal domain-containing pilus assembly protein [Vogesella urethralis]